MCVKVVELHMLQINSATQLSQYPLNEHNLHACHPPWSLPACPHTPPCLFSPVLRRA
jgi:hypothetical protein